MRAFVSRFSFRPLGLMAATALMANAAWAQAPNWVPIVAGESLYLDTASITLSPDAPAGAKWLEFDMVLNTPIPSTQEDAAQLNAFFGTEPKSFFNHATLNCDDMALREHSNGIAYGSFQTPRRDASGKPIQPFELDQLIEYDLHNSPTFEPVASASEAQRYAQLLCQSDTPTEAQANLSLIQLNQAVPSVTDTPELVALANYPNKFIDRASIKQHLSAPHIRDVNIVYQMPKDDPQFAQATEPYGIDQFTLVFDRSMNCQTRSMRSNYRAITPDYTPTSLLLEYRPQEDAEYLPITAEEQSLYDLVCPASEAVPTVAPKMAPLAPPVAAPVVTPPKPAAPIRRPSPFRTEYD
ncbi:MAG: hypothetical protein KA498_01970 [Neisseriaceae bacterium]|nr:hypothetical protein [Neisseriaceae bacterium]